MRDEEDILRVMRIDNALLEKVFSFSIIGLRVGVQLGFSLMVNRVMIE